jgi:hypothetical protein
VEKVGLEEEEVMEHLLFFNVASQCWYVQSFDPGLLLIIYF